MYVYNQNNGKAMIINIYYDQYYDWNIPIDR